MTPELTTRTKPDAEPFLLGAQLLGAAPGDCVVVEDAPAGVAAGIAAGMTVIAVLTTHARAELEGAAAYLTNLTEFPQALAELSRD